MDDSRQEVGTRRERTETDILNRKLSLRLLPFLCLLLFVAYLDRISLAYAAPNGMSAELGLTATAFGFAAGIFFVGYILFELPSNLALHRFGARKWLARIIVTWGAVQAATAFAPSAEVLYVLRFVLGMAEAGFAPGVILYLTYWFSSEYRGRAVSRFLFAVVVATVAGAPLSLWLINVGDSLQLSGFSGWRFLILVTGLPAILLGIVAWFYLVDKPSSASWLTQREKDNIEARQSLDAAQRPHDARGLLDVLRNGRIWLLGLCYFSFVFGAYALTFFLPAIVSGFEQQFGTDYNAIQTALLTSIPFVFGGLAQLYFGRRTDTHGHLGAHVAVATVIGLIGGLAATQADNPLLLIGCLCLMAIGINGAGPLVLIMTSKLYGGASAAAAIAIVNTLGITAGFLGPYLTGWLRDLTGASNASFLLISALLVMSGVIGLVLDRRYRVFGDKAPALVTPEIDKTRT